MLDQAHTALIQTCLAHLSPAGAQVALDLACGSGSKTPWLRAVCAPDALVLGLDHASSALELARATAPYDAWLLAEAQALPLRAACLDLIWCVAALQLFADPQQALHEAWRVLRPGGRLLVLTATTRWVRLRPAPTSAFDLTTQPLPKLADDLGYDLAALLMLAGFAPPTLYGFLLDPPGLGLEAAALPLLDWPGCEPNEPEPQPILLVAQGCKPLEGGASSR